jgi:hypothetical protein
MVYAAHAIAISSARHIALSRRFRTSLGGPGPIPQAPLLTNLSLIYLINRISLMRAGAKCGAWGLMAGPSN